MWGMRVVVPPSLRPHLLEEIHSTHMGVVRMKALAKMHMWWPRISKEIEAVAREYEACQKSARSPARVTLHPWSWPNGPFQRIHIDFAGPFMGHMFLIVVDAYSKWLEVKMMTSTTTQKTIGCLRELFASYGCPELLVSDNGPQFSSAEFSSFLSSNGVRHVRSPPYHPQSNGAAERCVQTFKGAMKSMKDEPGDIATKLLRFLFQYRCTPHATTGTSPAQLFLGRTLRTRLSMLHPDLAERVRVKQEKQQSSGPLAQRAFEKGDKVWARNYVSPVRWERGEITGKYGEVDYDVRVGGRVWHRHANQLRPHHASFDALEQPSAPITPSATNPPSAIPITPSVESETAPPRPPLSSPRRSVPDPVAAEPTGASATENAALSPSPPVSTSQAKPATPAPPEVRRNPPRERRPPDRLNWSVSAK